MAENAVFKQEAAFNTQLKQVSLDQEVNDKEIRKQEDRLNDFHELQNLEQLFYTESLDLQLDEQTTNLFQQATEEARWLAREELDRLEEKNDQLYQEKRNLLDQEDQLLMKRKQLFDEERSASTWG